MIQVKTNNRPRDILTWHDLSAAERAEFDYLDSPDRQDEAQFIRYRGVAYDLGEFTSLRVTGTPEFQSWHGVHADSYFSGVLVRFVNQCEQVIMGTFYS
jgi:hypothetical protein